MQPQQSFQEGVAAFRKKDFQTALACFNTAISNGGGGYTLYDSRAATLEHLGRIKEALRDSRRVIELAPRQRHGYIRSARLFLLTQKYNAALEMVQLALHRIPKMETARYSDAETLREKILAQKTAAGYSSTTFPFLKLPMELVFMIFTLVMESTPEFSVVSSGVCRDWRKFVISRPEYWGHLVLTIMSPQKKFLRWVERAKGRIIHLRLRQSLTTIQIRDILGLFSTHSYIFKYLKSFHAEIPLLAVTGLPYIDTNYDLEELRLTDRHARSVNIIYSLDPFLIKSRPCHIRSLWLERITVQWHNVIPQLFCLETLILRDTQIALSLEQLCTLFRQNPNINKVVLKGRLPWARSGPDLSAHELVLPLLHHLEVWGHNFIQTLVEYLSVSALQHLTLSKCASFADFVLRELPSTLREINLYECCFAPASLATCLIECGSLEKLRITHSSTDMDIIVNSLAETRNVDGVVALPCPQLTIVNFSHCPNLNGGPIVRLVKSRLLSSGAIIEEICLDGCPMIDPAVPPWLRLRVPKMSCVYMTKNEIRKIRR